MLHLQGGFRPRSPEMKIYLANWYQGGINCCMFAIRLQPTTTTASRNKARPRSWTSRRVSRNWDRLTGEILGQMAQCHETSWNLVSKPNAAHWRQAFATSHSWVFAAPYIVPSDVFFFLIGKSLTLPQTGMPVTLVLPISLSSLTSTWAKRPNNFDCSFLSFFSAGRKQIRLARQFPHNKLAASNRRPFGLAMAHDFSNRISVSADHHAVNKQKQTTWDAMSIWGKSCSKDWGRPLKTTEVRLDHVRKTSWKRARHHFYISLLSHLHRDPKDCVLWSIEHVGVIAGKRESKAMQRNAENCLRDELVYAACCSHHNSITPVQLLNKMLPWKRACTLDFVKDVFRGGRVWNL